MEHTEPVSTITHTPTTACGTPANLGPLSAPLRTEIRPQHDPRSPLGIDVCSIHSEQSLQSSPLFSQATTSEDGPISNPTPIGIDWANFNALSMLVPGHRLNELFPEVMEDIPELSDLARAGWSLPDLTPMDHVADSAALVNQEIDVTNINASDYEGILTNSDRFLKKPMTVCSCQEPLSSEPGFMSNPSKDSEADGMEETKVSPHAKHPGDILDQITLQEFDHAVTDYFTSHSGHEMSLPLRTRP
ncbi:MAG: hypothetical protein L6R42_000685 [Xanthoria sp. 1 TBL-2021]|nr:MAG: hypothetical protein L6R42_000685 [Xanthoria sp. 1 TBL-2021]